MGKLLEENLIDSMDASSKGTILRAMAVFTSIELCGSILTGKTGPSTTKDNFLAFVKSKYVDQKYHHVAELLFRLFRNGVAHSYIAKGGAILSSESNSSSAHMTFLDQGLFIYIPTLADDITKAVKNLTQDIQKEPILNSNYTQIIKQIDSEGQKYYKDFLQEKKIQTQQAKINRDIDLTTPKIGAQTSSNTG